MLQQRLRARRRSCARLLESMSRTDRSIGLGLLFGFFVMLVVSTLFGMLGGLFGALLFRKKPAAGHSAADSASPSAFRARACTPRTCRTR